MSVAISARCFAAGHELDASTLSLSPQATQASNGSEDDEEAVRSAEGHEGHEEAVRSAEGEGKGRRRQHAGAGKGKGKGEGKSLADGHSNPPHVRPQRRDARRARRHMAFDGLDRALGPRVAANGSRQPPAVAVRASIFS